MVALAQVMLIAEVTAKLDKVAEASLVDRQEKLVAQLGETFLELLVLEQQVIDAMMGITETMVFLD
jgi:fucose 4-O-acetylase-like acetyltransferase